MLDDAGVISPDEDHPDEDDAGDSEDDVVSILPHDVGVICSDGGGTSFGDAGIISPDKDDADEDDAVTIPFVGTHLSVSVTTDDVGGISAVAPHLFVLVLTDDACGLSGMGTHLYVLVLTDDTCGILLVEPGSDEYHGSLVPPDTYGGLRIPSDEDDTGSISAEGSHLFDLVLTDDPSGILLIVPGPGEYDGRLVPPGVYGGLPAGISPFEYHGSSVPSGVYDGLPAGISPFEYDGWLVPPGVYGGLPTGISPFEYHGSSVPPDADAGC